MRIVFYSALTQATLSFNLDYSSFIYLLEYSETFKGLSNVKQLALRPKVIWDDGSINSRRYKRWRGDESSLVGGNLETAAIYLFLQVTNSLDSLEMLGGSVQVLLPEQDQPLKLQQTLSQVSPNLTLQSSIFVCFQSNPQTPRVCITRTSRP